jgi:hypothetical protein
VGELPDFVDEPAKEEVRLLLFSTRSLSFVLMLSVSTGAEGAIRRRCSLG